MASLKVAFGLIALLAFGLGTEARTLAQAPAPAPSVAPSIYVLVWSGPDNPGPDCRDAVVVLDGTPESATFGQVVNVSFVPTWGNEPHHLGLANNSILAVGGIQAYLNKNPDIWFFNVSKPTAPVIIGSADPPLSAATDSFIAQADGGFFVSQMGSADGGTPGRIVRLNNDYPNPTVRKEFPENPPPGFNPHGFAIDAARNRIVTADYIDLKSSILPSNKVTYRHTLRVWELSNFTLLETFDAGPAQAYGFMTVQFIGNTGLAVSGIGSTLYVINTTDPKQVKPVISFGQGGMSSVLIPLAFSNGTRFVTSVLGQDKVVLLDSSDPWNWKVVQEIQLAKGSYPHAVSAARNGRLIGVSTYYIDQRYNNDTIGLIRDLGSQEVFFFDVSADGNKLTPTANSPVVDFKKAVTDFLGAAYKKCGTWRPHGLVFRAPPAAAPAPAPAPSVSAAAGAPAPATSG